MKKGLVKRNQIWREKSSGKLIKIMGKTTGNFHWTIKQMTLGKISHHIHEGTLQKFYILIKGCLKGIK